VLKENWLCTYSEDKVVIKQCISFIYTNPEQFESGLLINRTIIGNGSAAVVKLNVQQFETNANTGCCVDQV
jgi:hypothetical protein